MRLRLRLVGLVLLALPAPLFAQTPIPIPGVRPESVPTGLGLAVAASGTSLAATDFHDNAVYVFRNDSGTWALDARLDVPPGVLVGTRAGGLAFSGTRLVVGAPGADEGRGAAFVFERGASGWTQTARLEPSERMQYAQFGVSVALTGDRIVVGQTRLTVNRGEYDAAFVFARDAASGAWTQEARLVSGIPPNADDSQLDAICFGWSVAAHADQIAVGAPCANSLNPRGRAYVFRRDASGWTPGAPVETPTGGPVLGGVAFAGPDLVVSSSRGWHVYRDGVLATVLADTLASEGIAYSRALSGTDGLIVGLGRNSRGMHLVQFERVGGGWFLRRPGTFMPRPFASASSHVSGTPSHTFFGNWIEGYVIARTADGSRTDTLRAPGLERPFSRGTRAGASVDLSGGRLIVGLPGSDPAAPSAYADRRGGAVVLSPTLAALSVTGPPEMRGLGSVVRIGDGFAAVGNFSSYVVFGDDGSVWRTGPPPPPQPTIGNGLAVRRSTLAAGRVTAASASEVEVFRCGAATACVPEAVLTRAATPGYNTTERFGASVALDRTGTRLAVGAPVISGSFSPVQPLRVSLYARDAVGAWALEEHVSMPSQFWSGTTMNTSFGEVVARTRDTLVVTTKTMLHVFERTSAEVPFRLTARLTVPTVNPTVNGLAIGDGVIAYGVPSSTVGTPGRVLLFRASATGTGWELNNTLDGGTRGGSFGTSLAIDGRRLVVGAPDAANGAGEIVEYDLRTTVSAEREAAAAALSLRVPNPVRGAATVRYVLDRPARVRLTVYDVLGRRVSTLVDGDRDGGTHEIAFAAGLAPGAYVVRLDADGRGVTRTVVVVP